MLIRGVGARLKKGTGARNGRHDTIPLLAMVYKFNARLLPTMLKPMIPSTNWSDSSAIEHLAGHGLDGLDLDFLVLVRICDVLGVYGNIP